MLKSFITVVLFSLLCVHGNAMTRAHHRHIPERRLFVPSRDSLLAQNAAIDRLGLLRIRDTAELHELVQSGSLVQLHASTSLRVNVPVERAYVRPWVASFVIALGQESIVYFATPIQVNSAVRTEQVQRRLRRWNHNAAPIHGETASAHLAGVAIDLQRRGLSRAQVQFIEWRLLYWYGRGLVIVEEERAQPCFHVVVLRQE